jgi:hypothetical protein
LTTVRSVAGDPSSGSRWRKSSIESAVAQNGSSSLPSSLIVARIAVARIVVRCAAAAVVIRQLPATRLISAVFATEA